MKKMLMMLACAMAVSAAWADKVVLEFRSVGPDKYADGTTVMDGEYYALVWVKDGATFAGYKADGTLVDAANCQELLCKPWAKDGGLWWSNKQLDPAAAATLAGGSLKLVLLDTRLAGGKALAAQGPAGRPSVVNGWGACASAQYALGDAALKSDTVAFAANASALPAGLANPTIKAIQVKDGFAYLTVSGTVPFVQYNVAVGADPNAMGAADKAAPVNGDATKDIVLVVPAAGAQGFFKVGRNGLEK